MNFNLINFSEKARNFWFNIFTVVTICLFLTISVSVMAFWVLVYIYLEPMQSIALLALKTLQFVWSAFLTSALLFGFFYFLRKVLYIKSLREIEMKRNETTKSIVSKNGRRKKE